MTLKPKIKIIGDVVYCTNPYTKITYRVSLADIELVKDHIWNAKRKNRYLKRTIGHPRKDVYLHKLIMKPKPYDVVDFIDGDTMNCVRSNLRLCLKSDDIKNRGRTINNKTGYKGVYRVKSNGRYAAKIGFDGKVKHLGTFLTAVEAAEAYNNAAVKYHKEFARLNVIPKEL